VTTRLQAITAATIGAILLSGTAAACGNGATPQSVPMLTVPLSGSAPPSRPSADPPSATRPPEVSVSVPAGQPVDAVVITQTGGIAGVRNQATVLADGAVTRTRAGRPPTGCQLDTGIAQALRSADWNAIAAHPDDGRTRDQFGYTVATGGRTWTFSETSLRAATSSDATAAAAGAAIDRVFTQAAGDGQAC
jgi:hypothetical protein